MTPCRPRLAPGGACRRGLCYGIAESLGVAPGRLGAVSFFIWSDPAIPAMLFYPTEKS